MSYPKNVIRRNIRVKKLLNEVWVTSTVVKGYRTYINWGNVPLRTIKELIELEVLDLDRRRFLSAPISGRERNLLIHRRN